MKFTVSKTGMYSALQDVNHAVSSASPLPALKGIYIEVTDNEMILKASDSDVSIQRRLSNDTNENLNLQVEDPGAVVIDAKYVMDIVHKIDSDMVTVEIIDGALTMFTGRSAQFKINGMKASEYPDIDFTVPGDTMTIKSDVLAQVIEETCFAASQAETRPVLTGLNLTLKDGRLTAIATDSYRLARKEIPVLSDSEFSVTIPAKSMNEVKAILLNEEDKDIQISISRAKAQFIKEGIIFQTRLLEGAYPETDRLMPREFTSVLTIPRSALISVLDRSMFIKNDNMTINRLQASAEDILISNRSQEIGEFEQSLLSEGAKFEGKDLDISFSGTYVIAAARALKGDTIQVKFSGEMKPFILVDPQDDSLVQLALPVRSFN